MPVWYNLQFKDVWNSHIDSWGFPMLLQCKDLIFIMFTYLQIYTYNHFAHKNYL